MDSLLQIIEFLVRAGALGFLAYGLWLCLVIDPRVIAAVRQKSRGDADTPAPLIQPASQAS